MTAEFASTRRRRPAITFASYLLRVVAAAGLGIIGGIGEAEKYVLPNRTYEPQPQYKEIYDKGFLLFKRLYQNNRGNFALMNKGN